MKIETEYKGVKLPAKMFVWDFLGDKAKELTVVCYLPDAIDKFVALDRIGKSSVWQNAKPIPEKKMRLMTAGELKGKWLKDKVGNEFMVTFVNTALNQILLYEWISIKNLSEHGYMLIDGSSLMVECES